MLTRKVVLTIPANSVTAIRMPVGRRHFGRESADFVSEALKSDAQAYVQFCAYEDGKRIADVSNGPIPEADKGAARAKAEKEMAESGRKDAVAFVCTIRDPAVRKELRRKFYALVDRDDPGEK